MTLRVAPAGNVDGKFRAPSSKPETQRAVLLAGLTAGTSVIQNDLRCRETSLMKRALASLGVTFEEEKNHLRVVGTHLPHLRDLAEIPIVDCNGSGLVARVFTVLGSCIPTPVVVTGDDVLRRRVMRPLFAALEQGGQSLDYLAEPGCLPLVNRNRSMRGGVYDLPGDVSSQFITALLVAAPFARSAVEIRVGLPVLSRSYIEQTVFAMRRAGVQVEHADDMSWLRVEPGAYHAADWEIGADWTSASYIIERAILFPGRTVITHIDSESLQGERAILRVLEALQIPYRFDSGQRQLIIDNPHEQLMGDIDLDVSDSPNIVPTLAAIGAFVQGRMRVRGASITRLHKSPRVQAMVEELRKLDVEIAPLYRDSHQDGFEVRGRRTYEGGKKLSSWRDHRVFMSLFVATMRMRRPNEIDGSLDTDCSFPDFLEQFAQNGASFETVTDPEQTVALDARVA